MAALDGAPEVPNGLAESGVRQIERRFALLIAALAYAGVIKWSYLNVEADVYSHLGYRVEWEPVAVGLVFMVLAALPATWLPTNVERASDMAILVLYVASYVPTVVLLPQFFLRPLPEQLLVAFLLASSLAVVGIVPSFPTLRLPVFDVSPSVLAIVLVAPLAVLGALLWAKNGWTPSLSFGDVYDRRLAARAILIPGSPLSYAAAIAAGALVPLACAVMFRWRSLALGAAVAWFVLAHFSLTGQKSVVMTPLLAVAVFAFVKLVQHRIFLVALVGSALGVVVADAAHLTLGITWPTSLFTYRLLVAMARNTAVYFLYFAEHAQYHFAYSLRWLTPPVDRQPMSLHLGELFGYHEGMNLNVGIWASGFGELGAAGVFVMSILAGGLLWGLNLVTKDAPRDSLAIVGAYVGLLFTQMSATTAMITGGALPLLALLLLFRGSYEALGARGTEMRTQEATG